MAITIKDVAKLANVDPSTVSRVISNNSRISESTKVRVREAMDKLGYHPNFHARSLANKSTQSIGLVMPDSTDVVFQNPFFPEVIRGISKVAHEINYALHMSTGGTPKEIFEGVERMVLSGRVDGIILLYSRKNDKVMNYLCEKEIPFTLIGKPYKYINEITYVDNDNAKAAKDVTHYLIELGHQRIAFVGGDLSLVVTMDRLNGYREALNEAKIELNEDYIVHEEFLKEGGQEAINELLSLDEPPSALVVMDDLMAFGMYFTLGELGLTVPEDISIISFNNLLLTEISRPPLTSVDINIYQLGYQAAKCLIEKINNKDEPSKRIIVPYEIIERNSCEERPANS